MRLALLALGTRGDALPMIALGIGLRDSGHDISVVTHPSYAILAENFGLPVTRVRADVEVMLAGRDANFLRDADASNAELFIRFHRLISTRYGEMGAECLEASHGVDGVIGNPVSTIIALTIAEKLDVPAITSFWGPVYPSRCAPVGGLPHAPAWLGPVHAQFYWSSCLTVAAAQWFSLRGSVNKWRKSIGLRPLGLHGPLDRFLASTSLQAYSGTLVNRHPDWPDHVHITGHWLTPPLRGWSPPDDLARFLASGAPPVAVALGSMHRGTRKAEAIVAALRRCKLRGVFTGMGADPGTQAGDDMFYARDVPHDWLFRRASAVIHHAGAGTTPRVVLAGLPSVPLPLMNDEPFWAATLRSHGVATEAMTLRTLSVDRLAEAIDAAATDCCMRRRAQELGSRLATEDGVGRAVGLIEKAIA